MENRDSVNTQDVTIPLFIDTTGSVRCTDGIQDEVSFRIMLDDIDTMKAFVADRAKVAWRSRVATKAVKNEATKKLEERRLFAKSEIIAMGKIEISLAKFKVRAEKAETPVTAEKAIKAVPTMAKNDLEKLMAEMQAEIARREALNTEVK